MDVELELFGFQDGPEGFVRYGIDPPIDFCFLRVKGGRRSGKTAAGAMRMVYYMLTYPGSLGMVTAPVYHNIVAGTFPAIEKFFSKVGLRRGTHWEYNETKQELILFNGSRAFIRTTEHPERLPGSDLAWFWMDEPRLSPFTAWQGLQPALTQAGFPHTAWLTSTPAGRRHWMVKAFSPEEYLWSEGEENIERGTGTYRSFQAHTKDNPFGGQGIHDLMIGVYGGENSLLARQELYGEDVVMEGLVYQAWNTDYHVRPFSEWPLTKAGRKCDIVVAGVDFGHQNPFAIIVEGYDSETKTRYVLDEYCKSRLEPDDQARICKWLQRRHNIETFYCDATNPTMIRHLRSWGVPAIRAKNRKGTQADPTFGIGAVSAALNSKGREGKQGFIVHPKCKTLILEMETYSEDEPQEGRERQELPKGSHHDACDALRYAETGLLRHIGRGEGRSIRFVDVRYL